MILRPDNRSVMLLLPTRGPGRRWVGWWAGGFLVAASLRDAGTGISRDICPRTLWVVVGVLRGAWVERRWARGEGVRKQRGWTSMDCR